MSLHLSLSPALKARLLLICSGGHQHHFPLGRKACFGDGWKWACKTFPQIPDSSGYECAQHGVSESLPHYSGHSPEKQTLYNIVSL